MKNAIYYTIHKKKIIVNRIQLMWRWKGEEVTKKKVRIQNYSTDHTDRYTYFVILVFFYLRKNFFFLFGVCHRYRWRATHFYLYSALITVVQWKFFNVSQIVARSIRFYGQLRLPQTVKPVIVWQWSCHYPIYRFRTEEK